MSGHKSNTCNWLPSSICSHWEPMSKTAMEMGGLLEKGDAQNLQEFLEADVEAQAPPHDGDEQIDRENNRNLRLHGVLAGAIERFEPAQPDVLFDDVAGAIIVSLRASFNRPTRTGAFELDALTGTPLDR